MIPGAEEIGKTTRSFMDALKEQPLSLALVVMNFLLVGYLMFYTSSILKQRSATTDQIIKWQSETDVLMANCVSKDVLESVVGALERQLQEMRKQLNGRPDPVPLPPPRPPPPPPPPQ